MKRIFTIIIALALMLSSFAVSFAEEAATDTTQQSAIQQQANGDQPAPDSNGPINGTAPGMPNGEKPFDKELASLVEQGVISKETSEAISKYLEENRPEMPENGQMPQNGEKPDAPANGEIPEAPADGRMPDAPMDGGLLSSEMLTKLLDAGVITQNEYDAISALNTSADAND